ncbi:MAG: hypothetical protein QW470_04220 [Candidatus Caldarchaeum sp.]
MEGYLRKLLEHTGLDDRVLTMLEQMATKSVEAVKEFLELVEDETTPF